MFGATFWVNIVAEIMIWSLLAASVNLLFGYVGLLSFGQALYFGFGMYGVAIAISTWASGSGRRFALGIDCRHRDGRSRGRAWPCGSPGTTSRSSPSCSR